MTTMYPLAFHLPFMDEWVVIAFFGLLIFGKRLPEVGRSIGKGIVEFKKGLAGIEDDIDTSVNKTASTAASRPVLPAETAQPSYKFDPVTGEPVQPTAALPSGAKFDPFTGKPINADVVIGEVVASSPSNA